MRSGLSFAAAGCPGRERNRASGIPERRSAGGAGRQAALSRVAMARSNYFPPPPEGGGFASPGKIVCPRHPPLSFGPVGAIPLRLRPSDRREGRERRGLKPRRNAPAMTHDDSTFLFPDTDTEAEAHTASPTAHLLDELALYGHRPREGEPDPRPMPEADAVQAQLDPMVEAFSAMLSGTRLQADLS